MTEAANLQHWPADARGVYEVWYLTWNHPATDQGFWLRYITEVPTGLPRSSASADSLHVRPRSSASADSLHVRGARAELWFARFDPRSPERTFGVHKRFPIEQVAAAKDPFSITIAGSKLEHGHAIGQLAAAGHDIRWDLRWEPGARVLRLLPDVMYGGDGRAETTVMSGNPRVPLSGTIVVDGEQLTFDRAWLGQTHVFGRKHAYSWTWGRCAEFAGAPDALFEGLGVKLQRHGITTPPMVLVALDLDGERHRLNQLRHVAGNRGSWQTGAVRLSAWSPTVKLVAELTCTPDQMVNAPYLDPDGTELYCANTEIGDAHVTVWKRSGLRWREHRRLVGLRRAHFEIGGRKRDPVVVREHVLVE